MAPRIPHNDRNDPAMDVCTCGHMRKRHSGKCTAIRFDPFANIGEGCKCTAFVLKPRRKSRKLDKGT